MRERTGQSQSRTTSWQFKNFTVSGFSHMPGKNIFQLWRRCPILLSLLNLDTDHKGRDTGSRWGARIPSWTHRMWSISLMTCSWRMREASTPVSTPAHTSSLQSREERSNTKSNNLNPIRKRLCQKNQNQKNHYQFCRGINIEIFVFDHSVCKELKILWVISAGNCSGI